MPTCQGEETICRRSRARREEAGYRRGPHRLEIHSEGTIMRNRIIGGLLAIGLLTACGSAEDVGEEPLGTREAELPYCEGFSTVLYYSDATYSVVVGHGDCSCGHTLRVFGTKTDFAQYSPDYCS
jgi:hypothetical protein